MVVPRIIVSHSDVSWSQSFPLALKASCQGVGGITTLQRYFLGKKPKRGNLALFFRVHEVPDLTFSAKLRLDNAETAFHFGGLSGKGRLSFGDRTSVAGEINEVPLHPLKIATTGGLFRSYCLDAVHQKIVLRGDIGQLGCIGGHL